MRKTRDEPKQSQFVSILLLFRFHLSILQNLFKSRKKKSEKVIPYAVRREGICYTWAQASQGRRLSTAEVLMQPKKTYNKCM